MLRLAIFVKSYSPDAALLSRLLTSIEVHNTEGIPIYVSVPDDEAAQFRRECTQSEVTIIPDSVFNIPKVTSAIQNLSTGYIEQQLIKISVHNLNVAKTYAVIDSDCYFIRDFFHKDFLDDTDRGFTVLAEDKEQFAAPWYSSFADRRRAKVNAVADYFALPVQPRATCHGNTILSADVLSDFDSWRNEMGLTLIELMKIAPVEFSWYNFFMQKFYKDKIVRIEPFLRLIHTRGEFRSIIQQGLTTSALQRSYLGVCMNSVWAGKDQRREIRKLDKGSLLARTHVRIDDARYFWDLKVESFRFTRSA
jgi:hypothetical protein